MRIIPLGLKFKKLKGNVTLEECIRFWGIDLIDKLDDKTLPPYVDFLTELREELCGNVRKAVEEWLGRRAIQEDIKLESKEVVASFEQMKVAWRESGSKERAKKFWNASYGSVQGDRGSVFVEVETEAMRMMTVRYRGLEERRTVKDCWLFHYTNRVN